MRWPIVAWTRQENAAGASRAAIIPFYLYLILAAAQRHLCSRLQIWFFSIAATTLSRYLMCRLHTEKYDVLFHGGL